MSLPYNIATSGGSGVYASRIKPTPNETETGSNNSNNNNNSMSSPLKEERIRELEKKEMELILRVAKLREEEQKMLLDKEKEKEKDKDAKESPRRGATLRRKLAQSPRLHKNEKVLFVRPPTCNMHFQNHFQTNLSSQSTTNKSFSFLNI